MDVTSKYGEDESLQPTLDQYLWLGAIGAITKGRVYGFGDRQSAEKILGPATTSCTSRRCVAGCYLLWE